MAFAKPPCKDQMRGISRWNRSHLRWSCGTAVLDMLSLSRLWSFGRGDCKLGIMLTKQMKASNGFWSLPWAAGVDQRDFTRRHWASCYRTWNSKKDQTSQPPGVTAVPESLKSADSQRRLDQSYGGMCRRRPILSALFFQVEYSKPRMFKLPLEWAGSIAPFLQLSPCNGLEAF